jgi:hypothetical protein
MKPDPGVALVGEVRLVAYGHVRTVFSEGRSARRRNRLVFAISGDCGWPKYDPARRQTMRFDTTWEVVDDPLAAELTRWKGIR